MNVSSELVDFSVTSNPDGPPGFSGFRFGVGLITHSDRSCASSSGRTLLSFRLIALRGSIRRGRSMESFFPLVLVFQAEHRSPGLCFTFSSPRPNERSRGFMTFLCDDCDRRHCPSESSPALTATSDRSPCILFALPSGPRSSRHESTRNC